MQAYPHAAPPVKLSRADGACLAAALILAIAWTSAGIWWHPQFDRNDAFIFRDASHVLVVTDDLLSGRMLYKDVFYAYGPIAAYTYTLAASLFGNSPITLLCMQQLLTLTVVALSYRLLRSVLSEPTALCFLLVAVFPLIVIPGSNLADFSGLDYVSLERIGILVIALVWKPPEQRRLWHGVALGFLLGLLQGVKFGGAFVAGAALLATDLFFATAILRDKISRLCWLKVNLAILVTFCIIEAGWAALALGVLPHDIAIDAIWPGYLLESYQWYVSPTDRWPTWHNLGYFVTAQLLVLSCLLLVVLGFMATLRKSESSALVQAPAHAGKAIFLAAFFLIGCGIYFRHVWHFSQYAWTLVLPASLGFRCLRITLRAGLMVLWLPTTLASAKPLLMPPVNPLRIRETFPSGDSLWIEPARRNQLTELQSVLTMQKGIASHKGGVIFFPEGGGLHHLLGVPHPSRYFWFMGGLVQKHDEDDFVRSVSESNAIVVFFRQPQINPPEQEPNSWLREAALTPTFRKELNDRIRDLLAAPIMIDQSCWVFPIRHIYHAKPNSK